MKRLIPCLALIALVALAGCSGDSPSAQPVPTVVPTTWGIESLTVSDTTPFVGSPVLIDVEVTRDGSAAPDGTSVELSSSGPGTLFGFTSGVLTKSDLVLNEDATVITEDGVASVFFAVVPVNETDDPSGDYLIQARVNDALTQVVVNYGTRPNSNTFQLLSVNPTRGPYTGEQVVTLYGSNISTPIEVYFIVNGRPYPTEVIDTIVGTDGWIQVVTPVFAGQDWSIEQTADIRVTVSAGSTDEQTDTLFGQYTLLPESQTSDPVIFGVNPTSGRSSGGEVITIFGQDFGSVIADTVVEFVDTTGTSRLGSILAMSPDGTQIQVETPRFSTLPLAEDEPQDVVVTTANGSDTLSAGFIVLADEPEPTITAISPTSGPLDGGTLVTIFGSGFQVPMQVWFGNLTALDVNVFNDTTPADNDRITCVTPDYSQQGEVVPVTVDVRTTNMTSGKTDTLSGAFTYGDELYISGNSPSEGGLGDLVIIYGSGFEDPLQVFFGDEQMEVVSVSGTELVVRIPDDLGTSCAATNGDFKVVLLESNRETEGGNFTIRGNNPTVLSVAPIIIQETDLGTAAADISITGQSFSDEVLVTVGAYTMPSSRVIVNSDTSIDVEDLPDVNTLGIAFDTTPCTTTLGEPGAQLSSTPVSVGVTNFPGACTDTLPGAIVVEPSAFTCTALEMQAAPPLIAFGSTASTQTFIISNIGPATFQWSATLSDPDGVFSMTPASGSLAAGQATQVAVTFTYAGATASHNGSVSFTTNPVGILGSSDVVTLTATTP